MGGWNHYYFSPNPSGANTCAGGMCLPDYPQFSVYNGYLVLTNKWVLFGVWGGARLTESLASWAGGFRQSHAGGPERARAAGCLPERACVPLVLPAHAPTTRRRCSEFSATGDVYYG
jgi:hypothetical protein